MLASNFLRLLSLTALATTGLVQLTKATPPHPLYGKHYTPCAKVSGPEPKDGHSKTYIDFQSLDGSSEGNNLKISYESIGKQPTGMNFHATITMNGKGNVNLWNQPVDMTAVKQKFIYRIQLTPLGNNPTTTLSYYLYDFDSCDIDTNVSIDLTTDVKIRMYQL